MVLKFINNSIRLITLSLLFDIYKRISEIQDGGSKRDAHHYKHRLRIRISRIKQIYEKLAIVYV